MRLTKPKIEYKVGDKIFYRGREEIESGIIAIVSRFSEGHISHYKLDNGENIPKNYAYPTKKINDKIKGRIDDFVYVISYCHYKPEYKIIRKGKILGIKTATYGSCTYTKYILDIYQYNSDIYHLFDTKEEAMEIINNALTKLRTSAKALEGPYGKLTDISTLSLGDSVYVAWGCMMTEKIIIDEITKEKGIYMINGKYTECVINKEEEEILLSDYKYMTEDIIEIKHKLKEIRWLE